jgi:hypothetical protein
MRRPCSSIIESDACTDRDELPPLAQVAVLRARAIVAVLRRVLPASACEWARGMQDGLLYVTAGRRLRARRRVPLGQSRKSENKTAPVVYRRIQTLGERQETDS